MRSGLAALAAALLVMAAPITQNAWAQGRVDNTRRSMGNLQPSARRAPYGRLDNTRRSMGNLRPDSYTAGRAFRRTGPALTRRAPVVVVPQPYYGGYRYPVYYGAYPTYYPSAYGYYGYYPAPYAYYGGYPYLPPPVVVIPYP